MRVRAGRADFSLPILWVTLVAALICDVAAARTSCAVATAASSPDSPLELPIAALAASGNVVYAGQGHELLIVDIADPGRVQLVGQVTLAGSIVDLEARNGVLYAALGTAGVAILDLADPLAPVIVDTPTDAEVWAVDIDLGPQRALVVSPTTLVVLSLADPLSPRLLGRLPVAASRVVDGGARAYIFGDRSLAYPAPLQIVDLADPEHPRLLASIDGGFAGAGGVLSTGERILLADQRGVHLLDVADPDHVSQVDVLRLVVGDVWGTPQPQFLLAQGGLLWHGAFDGVRVVDASTSPIRVVGQVSTVEVQTRPVLAGSTLVAAGHRGLVTIDVSDPSAPRLYPERPRTPWFHGAVGNVAVIREATYGDQRELIRLVDLESPGLEVVGALPPRRIFGVLVAGTQLATSNELGLELWRLDDPTLPVRLDVLAGTFRPALAVAADRLYAVRAVLGADGRVESETLVAFDVAAGRLEPRGEQPLEDRTVRLFADGPYVFRSTTASTLEVFAREPLTLLGDADLPPGLVPAVIVDGRMLRTEASWVVAYDLSDPLAPQRLGGYLLGNGEALLAATATRALVGWQPTLILDWSDPRAIVVRGDLEGGGGFTADGRVLTSSVLELVYGRWFEQTWRSRLTLYDPTACFEPPPPCVPGPTTLCLEDGRFEVTAEWSTESGSGDAQALPLNPTTGSFWYFRPDNLELLVKVLDGCPVSDSHWAFATGLTDVATRLRVRDSWTGAQHVVVTWPRQRFGPIQSTTHLHGCDASPPVQAAVVASSAPLAADGSILPLDLGRFEVRASWTRPDGARGQAQALPLTADSGAFWFFREDNLELMVKVVDACAEFDRYWVFAAGLTNVGVEWSVRDTLAEEERSYASPLGTPFATVTDTDAFATCP